VSSSCLVSSRHDDDTRAPGHLRPQDVIDLQHVLFAEHVVIVAPRQPGQQSRWSRFLDSPRKAIGPASRDAVRTQSMHDSVDARTCRRGRARRGHVLDVAQAGPSTRCWPRRLAICSRSWWFSTLSRWISSMLASRRRWSESVDARWADGTGEVVAVLGVRSRSISARRSRWRWSHDRETAAARAMPVKVTAWPAASSWRRASMAGSGCRGCADERRLRGRSSWGVSYGFEGR
jgi:hypothetical protein